MKVKQQSASDMSEVLVGLSTYDPGPSRRSDLTEGQHRREAHLRVVRVDVGGHQVGAAVAEVSGRVATDPAEDLDDSERGSVARGQRRRQRLDSLLAEAGKRLDEDG